MNNKISKRQAAKIFRECAKVLETNGWVKHAMMTAEGSYCALGVMGSVLDDDSKRNFFITRTFRENINKILAPEDAIYNIASWNDSPTRKKSEVVSAFRAVARSLEHGGPIFFHES